MFSAGRLSHWKLHRDVCSSAVVCARDCRLWDWGVSFVGAAPWDTLQRACPTVCTEAVGVVLCDPEGERWWHYCSQLVGVFVSPDGS